MKSITPAVHRDAILVTFAKDQPEYNALVGSVGPDGTVMTEWEFTDEERKIILEGGRIRLWLLFAIDERKDRRLTPIAIETVK